ncbi:nitroreductase family protein [Pelosinus sp. sgz500959]|uniref:nitroreductase family protein n=1 Tax=Pelosinus sp. sgz500959 TaxID=3242472 RepID=UPI00366EE070
MELMKIIAMRKSTRNYKSKQINDESLNTILVAGCAAPVGIGAYHEVHMTVIQNPDLLDRISKATANLLGNPKAKPLYGAPTLVIISGKPNDKAPTVAIANASCIIENMTLAATNLNIGSVYLLRSIFAINANQELIEDLNLPEGFFPAAGIALGYPNEPFTIEKELKQTIQLNIIK